MGARSKNAGGIKRKIRTFDGPSFWKAAYAHQRAALLRMIGTQDGEIERMISMAYLDLPLDTRYDIETSPDVDRASLQR